MKIEETKEDFTQEEIKTFKEIEEESVEESKKPEPDGKIQGIVGIILGIFGLILVVLSFYNPATLIILVFVGFVTSILGIYAIKHKRRTLGSIAIILALINLIPFFLILLNFNSGTEFNSVNYLYWIRH